MDLTAMDEITAMTGRPDRATPRERCASPLHRIASVGALVLAVVALAACGGSDGGSGGGGALSEAGARGQTIARSNGCSGCHGTSGQGGVGPSWVDLYGSDVELDDGTTVVADETYLARAISDPGAEKVKDASVVMPSNRLTDEQIADVIAYIRDLSPNAGSGAGAASGDTGPTDTTVDE